MKKYYIIVYCIPGNSNLTRLVHGIWETESGAKEALEKYKKHNPNCAYGIASYPVYKDGEGPW